MATRDSSVSTASAGGGGGLDKIETLKESLYFACQDAGDEGHPFSQRDLLGLDIIPNDDMNLLLKVVQQLCNDKQLIPVNDSRGGLAWKWRNIEEAKKYKTLTNEQAMVYQMVDESGQDGVWSRMLKMRLNMHDSVLRAILKELEKRRLIRPMKSVVHPSKKMYIRYDLQPSERATGGPWYTDQELDEAFVAELQSVVFGFIKSRATYRSKHGGAAGPAKKPAKGGTGAGADARGKKRGADQLSADDQARQAGGNGGATETILPLPAGFKKYPTVRQIAEFIDASGITNNTTLAEGDVQQLVDVLQYDGRIEPVFTGGGSRKRRQPGYRVVRLAQQSDPDADFATEAEAAFHAGARPQKNGMTEAPCGRCPVFDLCEEGGKVSPSTCEYYQQWLMF